MDRRNFSLDKLTRYDLNNGAWDEIARDIVMRNGMMPSTECIMISCTNSNSLIHLLNMKIDQDLNERLRDGNVSVKELKKIQKKIENELLKKDSVLKD